MQMAKDIIWICRPY